MRYLRCVSGIQIICTMLYASTLPLMALEDNNSLVTSLGENNGSLIASSMENNNSSMLMLGENNGSSIGNINNSSMPVLGANNGSSIENITNSSIPMPVGNNGSSSIENVNNSSTATSGENNSSTSASLGQNYNTVMCVRDCMRICMTLDNATLKECEGACYKGCKPLLARKEVGTINNFIFSQ
ncbi:hypothetical protein CQW23_19131 [Capsicum baccatum]|uniref:Uncharacterized protein n=1 Tax=Capsicum baccatum TaxID=33114 RepID=A0A2G2W4X4_CAPBA|nr:hypothetical protein CQW23_19131 [Capsicum baccatum]